MTGYLRSLNPRLPRSVQTLQAGGLVNAFGNGVVLPFTFIYLHNVRGFGLGAVGLVLATNAGVSLIAGPVAGSLVDRVGGRAMLGIALVFLALGFLQYPFIHEHWQGFLASATIGIGNGAFWPAQSTLIAGLTPPEKRNPAGPHLPRAGLLLRPLPDGERDMCPLLQAETLGQFAADHH